MKITVAWEGPIWNITIELKNFGGHHGARFHGKQVRESIIAPILSGTYKTIFDLSGVLHMYDSFADEYLAKLPVQCPMEILKEKTTFVNGSLFVRQVMADAFKAWLSAVLE